MLELLPVYVHHAASCFLKIINKRYETLPSFSRGNWWGHAPYKYGAPCSACPASYAGGCRDNLCYKGTADGSVDGHTAPETEDSNYIEPESARDKDHRPRAQNPNTTPSDNPERHQFVSTEQMSMDQTIRSTFECVHGSEYFINPRGNFCDGVCGFRSAGPL